MPFKFAHLCSLLSDLEKVECHDPPLLVKHRQELARKAVEQWVWENRRCIDAADTDAAALLSSLFPERRTDLVYGLQEASLSKLLGRCLFLSASKYQDLQEYKKPGRGDLGACVQRVLEGTQPATPIVTVEEVDSALHDLASRSRFSGPNVRHASSDDAPERILGHIYLRLRPEEAKWLTRMILKKFGPVVLDEYHVLRTFHFLLPDLLKFQQNFGSAVKLLKGPLAAYPPRPDRRSEIIHRGQAAKLLRPKVGVKISRPNFQKARSIDHCLKMVSTQRWSLERKYDGEYCEVHIDLTKGDDCIQIFSKSGKDSTMDRKGVHGTIRQCLQIGRPSCKFEKHCILLGELVVWSDAEQRILPFHKIRKYVSRSGSFLGTDQDSQAHAHEHLMLVFFDILLVDDDLTMTRSHEQRRERLRSVITKKRGRAITAEWKILDFSTRTGKQKLVEQFAASIANRCEGLVLKPTDGPYFPLSRDSPDDYRSCLIKLKKDYMKGMGDEADFAVVGASYRAKEAPAPAVSGLNWTTFHLGCLTNKESVKRFGARPVFKIVESISQDHCIAGHDLIALSNLGQFRAEKLDRTLQPKNFDLELDSSPASRMDATFTDPFVFEVLGSSYDKPSNKAFYMLRHPRVLKIHWDRTWKDTISFDELQSQAGAALAAPANSESQETTRWLEKLERSWNRRLSQESVRTTPRSAATTSPLSIRRSPRKPKVGLQQPMFVRVDTEQLPPNFHRELSPILQRRRGLPEKTLHPAALHNSLPTPPTSSPTGPEKQRPGHVQINHVVNPVQESAIVRKRKINGEQYPGGSSIKKVKLSVSAMQTRNNTNATNIVDNTSYLPNLTSRVFHSKSPSHKPLADITNSPPRRSKQRSNPLTMPNNRELHRIDLTEPDLIDLTDSDDVNENVPDTIAGAEPTSSELGKRQASTRPQHDEHPYYAVAGAEVTTLEPTKHKALNLEHDQDEYFAEFIASVEPATDEPLQQYAPTSPGRDKHLPDAADGGVSLLDEAAAYIAGMDVAMNEPNYQQALTTLGQHGNFFHTVNGGMSLSNEAADLIAGMLLPINEPGKQQALTSSEQDYSSSDTDVDGDLFPNSTTEQRAIFTPERVPEHDRHFLHSPTPPFRPRSPSPQPPSSPGKCAYRRTAHPACPFSNAVVYLAPCIATTPYIRDDLAPAHGIVLVNSLTHWTRDSAPSTSTTSTTGTATALAETLAESQSHPGLVKILLLETRRREACRAAVDAVTRAVRERVLCYDWRVLEDLADAEAEAHAEAMMDAREEAAGGGGRPVPCLQEQSALLHRWYAGRVEWDARRACAVWTRAGSGCELSFLG